MKMNKILALLLLLALPIWLIPWLLWTAFSGIYNEIYEALESNREHRAYIKEMKKPYSERVR